MSSTGTSNIRFDMRQDPPSRRLAPDERRRRRWRRGTGRRHFGPGGPGGPAWPRPRLRRSGGGPGFGPWSRRSCAAAGPAAAAGAGARAAATSAPRRCCCSPRSRATATRSCRSSRSAASGVWRPSPGSVYPALQQLEDEGLIRSEEADGRRLYHLTDAGRAYVAERPEDAAGPVGELQPTTSATSTRETARSCATSGMAFVQVLQRRQRGAGRRGGQGPRRDAPRPLPDPGRRRARRGGRLSERADGRRGAARPDGSGGTGARRRSPSAASRSATARSRPSRGIDFDVARGRDLRLPRAQRRRQVDDDQDALHARRARPAASATRRRPRRRRRARRGPPQHRPRLPGHDARRLPDRRAEPALPRRALRRAERGRADRMRQVLEMVGLWERRDEPSCRRSPAA